MADEQPEITSNDIFNIDSTNVQDPELRKALGSLASDRNLNTYTDILGASLDDLGSEVLDLGSGLFERFSREASCQKINVTSVNPKLINKKSRDAVQAFSDRQGRSMAALATQLPFKDNSFDSVVSLFAIPMYLPPDHLEQSFLETIRVLKSKRKAFFAPIAEIEQKNLKTILDSNNINYSFGKISKGLITDYEKFYRLTLIKK